ncbi:hypothetical protein POVCU2_0026120 [Plasmodium ovale curtisi]|uniref:Uncharacterized protein n=1 Tax=Plasmodium ovale curtisi TaxID=864141 RepID=A0A1A8WIG5_PLAOA|nr:hypothetical protein POVCU2_0026120 [Plasmodium ovale curtisi]SBS92718.1 hypothetical protein POVCU1_023850 [Plasmodium ovale curtisi]
MGKSQKGKLPTWKRRIAAVVSLQPLLSSKFPSALFCSFVFLQPLFSFFVTFPTLKSNFVKTSIPTELSPLVFPTSGWNNSYEQKAMYGKPKLFRTTKIRICLNNEKNWKNYKWEKKKKGKKSPLQQGFNNNGQDVMHYHISASLLPMHIRECVEN